jgi:hypothetical protein
MQIEITYKHPQYGEGNVSTLPIDVMKWERMTKQKFTELYRQGPDGETEVHIGISDLATMLFAVLTRTGVVSTTYDMFIQDLQEVMFGDEPDVNPTKAEPLAADS